MENTPSSPESARPRKMTLEEAREAKRAIRAAAKRAGLRIQVGILPIEYGNVVSINTKTETDAAVLRDFVKEHFSNVPVKVQAVGFTQAG